MLFLSLLSSLNRLDKTTNELPSEHRSRHNVKPNPEKAVQLHKGSALGQTAHPHIFTARTEACPAADNAG